MSFEVSSHSIIRPQLYLKTPSRNAFRPETPELPDLKESDFEDFFGILAPLAPSPETPYCSERSRKSLHRKSSVIGSVLTLPSTQWSPRIEAEIIRPQCDDAARVSHLSPSSFLDESEGEEEECVLLNSRRLSQESDLPAVKPPPFSANVYMRQVSESTLFPHQHGMEQSSLKSCCWPHIAETYLAQSAFEPTLHAEPICLGSEQMVFTHINLSSTIPNRSAILDEVQNIVFKIDSTTVTSDDISRLTRFADSLSAARFFDDSFIWSQIIWRLLIHHQDPTLASIPIYSTGVPAWLAVFTNMAKSCTGPEHLQLMALAIQDIQLLESFSIDVLHPSISLLYTFLGDALQRLSDTETATDAAIGCWTLARCSSSHLQSYIMKKVVISAITIATDSKDRVSEQTRQQLEFIHASAHSVPVEEAIASGLDLSVRDILAWCQRVLEDNDFARMIEDIDENFWTSSASSLDVARFERLAVLVYLCQSMWSQERIDAKTSCVMYVDVVNALQTMTKYTGLTHEATLSTILGITMPILKYSTTPERCTMASRFSHRMGELYDQTAMAASEFHKFGRVTKIDDLMNRYTWAGNSKSSFEEFDNHDYARRVGVFLRDNVSRGLDISSSRALCTILSDLREGGNFAPDTLLPSIRSSQMSTDARSMISLQRRISKNGKILRASNSSWKFKACDCESYNTGIFGLQRTLKDCSCTRNGSNTSLQLDRLSEIFYTRMSLDGDSGKHVSVASGQMVWSSIAEDKELEN